MATRTTPNKVHKLSPAQRLVLTNLADGRPWDAHVTDRRAYGGARTTFLSLQGHGYIQTGTLTAKGWEALGHPAGHSRRAPADPDDLDVSPTAPAACIGCGCTDSHACYDERDGGPCYWVRVDRTARLGVCSTCRELAPAWDAGDRARRPARGTPQIPGAPRIHVTVRSNAGEDLREDAQSSEQAEHIAKRYRVEQNHMVCIEQDGCRIKRWDRDRVGGQNRWRKIDPDAFEVLGPIREVTMARGA